MRRFPLGLLMMRQWDSSIRAVAVLRKWARPFDFGQPVVSNPTRGALALIEVVFSLSIPAGEIPEAARRLIAAYSQEKDPA